MSRQRAGNDYQEPEESEWICYSVVQSRHLLLIILFIFCPLKDLNAHLRETEDVISTIYDDASLKKVSWKIIHVWSLYLVRRADDENTWLHVVWSKVKSCGFAPCNRKNSGEILRSDMYKKGLLDSEFRDWDRTVPAVPASGARAIVWFDSKNRKLYENLNKVVS